MTNELSVLDTSNPRSIVSLVTEKFRSYIAEIPEELLNRKEFEIIKIVYADEPNGHPNPVDSVLRRNFWDEYNRVQADELLNMNMSNVFKGVCSEPKFYDVVKNPRKLAYILTEPNHDKVKSQYALDLVWDKIIALASMKPEINSKTGLPDSKVFDLQLKLFQFLEQQKHGSLVQRIKQETTQTNVNIDANKAIEQVNTQEEVQKILEEVKNRLSVLPTPPEPRLVLPVESSYRDAGRMEPEIREMRDVQSKE